MVGDAKSCLLVLTFSTAKEPTARKGELSLETDAARDLSKQRMPSRTNNLNPMSLASTTVQRFHELRLKSQSTMEVNDSRRRE